MLVKKQKKMILTTKVSRVSIRVRENLQKREDESEDENNTEEPSQRNNTPLSSSEAGVPYFPKDSSMSPLLGSWPRTRPLQLRGISSSAG